MILKFLMVITIGYILGSIPFGLLFGKLRARVDIRQFGSGRTGSTNVLRTLGRKAFVTVAALDVLKGTLAAFLGGLIIGHSHILLGTWQIGATMGQALGALMAVVGHIWPVFAKFKGGRGVGTFIGGMFGLCPAAALFGGEILLIGACLSGFASLGSLTGLVGAYTIMIPLTFIYGYPWEYQAYALVGSVLIILMHHDNIKRLMSGKERKLNQKVELSHQQAA
jgi:glycerol-3-phosphate acyltransferase PlsY